jgi:hypothetical protein
VNRAFEVGRKIHAWWPDWTERPVAVVASGPSTGKFPVEDLRDRFAVIAIKATVDKVPWADVVYGCDDPWWRSRRGLQDFSGIKISHGRIVTSQYKDIHKVEIKSVARMLVDEPLVIGSGKNSGFQAVNLAVQFGAKKILLVGFDMSDRGGTHWYGRNTAPGMSNPTEFNFQRWCRDFADAKSDLDKMGVKVINGSPMSALKCFPFGGIQDAVA